MNISFTNKSVLVTGGSRGIGKAIVTMFAESGAKVIIHYNKDQTAANHLLNTIQGDGHMIVQADLASPDSIAEMVSQIHSVYEKVDILVNNAGIYDERESLDLEYNDFQRFFKKTMDINLTGPVNLSFLIARHMKAHGGGKIVNITSRGAFRGEPSSWPYGASKAAMNAVGQSMAVALAPDNISVYTIAPGYVFTDMTQHIMESSRGPAINKQSPLNRIAQPEEIARVVLMVSGDGSEYMTGCIIDVNGASYLRS